VVFSHKTTLSQTDQLFIHEGFKNQNPTSLVGEQGWYSGESAHLAPMWPGSILVPHVG